VHKGFRGTREDGKRYYALEPKAYAWVHATLLESYVAGHAHFGKRMSRPEVESFYREYRGLGRLAGVRDHDLPPDWAGFRDYFDGMVESELCRTVSVDRVLRSVKDRAHPPVPMPDLAWRAISAPAQRSLWLGGIGLLGPSLRERLGVEWMRGDERAFRALGAVSRRMTPVMPRRLQVMGPDQLRLRRRAIARGPLGSGDAGGAQAHARPSVAA